MEPENKSEFLNNRFKSLFITDDFYSEILTNVFEMKDLERMINMATEEISFLKSSIFTPKKTEIFYIKILFQIFSRLRDDVTKAMTSL